MFLNRLLYVYLKLFGDVVIVLNYYKHLCSRLVNFIVNNRLRGVIGSVVYDSQSAFVKGKQILDSILIVNEVVDEKRRMGKELLIFKVDLEKAYDSVDFKYLDSVMVNMNFSTIWRKWIYECIWITTTSILVNGSPT